MSKKLLFCICFCLITCNNNINAQKIIVDRIESDGSRQIMTKTKNFSIGESNYHIGLKTFEEFDNSLDWYLVVGSFSYIPSYTEALIKLRNEEILYLISGKTTSDDITTKLGYRYTHYSKYSAISYDFPSIQEKYYVTLFKLNEEQLKKIHDYGIKRFRISVGTTFNDREFSGNALGLFIDRSYKKILNRQTKIPLKKKDLFDNF